MKFTFEELSSAIHLYSHKKFVIGRGDFGKVYKGCLPSGEFIVAKGLKSARYGEPEEELENQLKDFASVSHPNLVKLVGYSESEFIVLEFVSNKSLKFHLSGKFQDTLWIVII